MDTRRRDDRWYDPLPQPQGEPLAPNVIHHTPSTGSQRWSRNPDQIGRLRGARGLSTCACTGPPFTQPRLAHQRILVPMLIDSPFGCACAHPQVQDVCSAALHQVPTKDMTNMDAATLKVWVRVCALLVVDVNVSVAFRLRQPQYIG